MKLQSPKTNDPIHKLISHILLSLSELRQSDPSDPFIIGQKYAYVECLEFLQVLDIPELDFDIEKEYPLE